LSGAAGYRLLLAAAGAIWIAAPCALAQQIAPVRFALSFDDGPSGNDGDNPTESILDALAKNSTQAGIKAIFFVTPRGTGVTPRGRALLEREHAQGHVLALHDGSSRRHPNHRMLSNEELEESLRDGVADLMAITGLRVALQRPPYWAYDARTLVAYTRHGLTMLLTDVSANDGKAWGFRASPRRYSHMASELARVHARMKRGEIAAVEGVTPVVVTFHDSNDYTAAHIHEYLRMLVDQARAAGLALAARPFYDDGAELERAALARGRDIAHRADMVPWWWRWILW
jgi:peptidoglycan/xylan/chitin deacetylase (PgdA/CDA1 family)